MNQSMYRAVPTLTFNSNSNIIGNEFKARPLKQWRKQLLRSQSSSSNVSMGMPMDRPGGSAPSNNACNQACHGTALLEERIGKDSPCTSCGPIKLITSLSDTHYTDNNAYMQSRCIKYEQRLAYNPVSFITYISASGNAIEPSDSPNGTQVRETNNCYGISSISGISGISSNYTPLTPCNTTIYKPNNSQFAQQGGVSSGSRISRLKYNTLNNNGSAYQSASGAVGVNTGYYQTEPSPSYYTKLKPQKPTCGWGACP